MENEQTEVKTSTIQSTTDESTSITSEPESKVDEKPVEGKKPFKIYETEEEYNKDFKSNVSKAKNEWLKETGVLSVDDFKSKQAEYNKAINENKTLKESLESEKKNHIMDSLNIQDKFKDDFLAVTKNMMESDSKLDFKSASAKVLEKNPWWVNSVESTKIGTEKSTYVSKDSEKDPFDRIYAKYRGQ